MSMVIKNNMAAVHGLGQLNKNISNAAKDLKKLSSGAKINGAGDDASGLRHQRAYQVYADCVSFNHSFFSALYRFSDLFSA